MTKIEWTERTWNPIVGCSIVSPGCTNCYAMKMAARIESMGTAPHYAGTTKRVNGNAVWTGKLALAPEHILLEPLRRKKPTMHFVNSMSDLCHEDLPDEWIDRPVAVMAATPHHTYQILTKRSARQRQYWSDLSSNPIGKGGLPLRLSRALESIGIQKTPAEVRAMLPLRNVWLGVSAERQQEADARIPDLLATPAAVRFVSAEPLLGPIDFRSIKGFYGASNDYRDRDGTRERMNVLNGSDRREHLRTDGTWNHRRLDDPDGDPAFTGNCHARLNWVIVGGESGHGARPMHPDLARDIRDQCNATGVAFFFKQWGRFRPGVWESALSPVPGSILLHSDGRTARNKAEARAISPHTGLLEMVDCGSKKAAGRLLDGREWNEMPTPRKVAA